MAQEPLRSASRDPPRRGERLVQADGHGKQPRQLGVGHEVGRRQRLLDAQHVEVGQAAQHRDVLGAGGEGAVGVDLEHEVGVIGPHGAHGLEHPAGLDLQPHPGRTGLHRGVDLPAQRGEVVVLGDPHHGARRQRLEAGGDPESIGQERPSTRSSASATAISKTAASIRSTGELPNSCATPAAGGSSPPRAAVASQRRGTPRSTAACCTAGEGRIHGGAVGQRAALAPPLGLVGHDADEEQRAHPVGAGGGADGLAERELHVDELDAAELHGGGPPTPPP